MTVTYPMNMCRSEDPRKKCSDNMSCCYVDVGMFVLVAFFQEEEGDDLSLGIGRL